MIELLIETLTGTCFELRVSPFETVMAVKSKIQRMEGIPMSHQYLIFQNIELKDEDRLIDYSIKSGSKLKLVLAMRGGPINTHKITLETSEDDFADYMDMSQAELLENFSSNPDNQSSKQITLLVYRDGDQLNFFRVVDRGDGTLTPLSETCSEGSTNLEEEAEPLTTLQQQQAKWQNIAKMIENNVTAAKMKKLCAKTKKINLNNNKPSPPNATDITPIPPRTAKPKLNAMSNASRRLFKQASVTNEADKFSLRKDLRPQTSAELGGASEVIVDDKGDLVKVNTVNELLKPKLPPMQIVNETNVGESPIAEQGIPRSPRTRRLMNALAESRRDVKRVSNTTYTTTARPPLVGQGLAFNRHEMYLRSYGLIPASDSPDDMQQTMAELRTPSTEQRAEEFCSSAKKMHETSHGVKYSSIGNSTRYNQRFSAEPSTMEWVHNPGNKTIDQSEKYKSDDRELFSNYDRLRRKYGVLPPTIDPLVSTTTTQEIPNWSHFHGNTLLQRSSSALAKNMRHPVATPMSSNKYKENEIDLNENSLDKQYSGHRVLKMNENSEQSSQHRNNNEKSNSAHGDKISRQSVREVVDFVNKAIDTSVLCGAKSPLKDHRRNSGHRTTKNVNLNFQNLDKISKNMMGSAGNRLSGSSRGRGLPSTLPAPNDHFLPPVKRNSNKKYCFLCRKKTGLATSFICRCGNNFCTTHRYAESHQCTFDYKTQGRKLLKENNPLVSAPKLPKI